MSEIRTLHHEDLDALLALYAHLHDDDPPLPAERAAQLWRSIEEGRLIATCALSIVQNLTRGGRPYGLIENVVTHPAYRRRGLAKAVLRAAMAHAWAEGCYKLMLMTGRKDAGTLAFYRAAGFDADAKQAFFARPAS